MQRFNCEYVGEIYVYVVSQIDQSNSSVMFTQDLLLAGNLRYKHWNSHQDF